MRKTDELTKKDWVQGLGDEDIMRLTEDGFSIQSIADKLCVPYSIVYKRRVALRLTGDHPLDPEMQDRICDMSGKGMRSAEIAQVLGIERASVVICLNRVNSYKRKHEEKDQIIRDMFAAGASDAEIAARIGESEISAANRRRHLGLVMYRRKTSEITPEQLSELVKEGLTDSEIAKLFGIRAKSAIARWRKQYGIERAPRVGEKDIDERDLRHLIFDKGMTDKQIAAHYGCSYMTVYNRRKHLGIERERSPRVPEDDLRQYVNAGMTDVEISEKTGVSLGSIKDSVRKFGLTGIRRTLALTDDEIKALFDAGESDEQIAQKARCKPSAIKGRRYGMGFPSAPHSACNAVPTSAMLTPDLNSANHEGEAR